MNINKDKIFSTVQVDDSCHECPYVVQYIEEYEIGHSSYREVSWDCNGSPERCEKVQDKVQELEEFIKDNQDLLDLL